MINIITKKSQVNAWNLSLTNQLESVGRRNHTAQLGYQKGKFNVGVHGRYFEYDQFPADSMRLLRFDTLANETVISTQKYPFNPKEQTAYGGYARYNFNEENHINRLTEMNAFVTIRDIT